MKVKRRTKELDESNKQLAIANEQLTLHDKMQKEFINVAAHELKTPIQPIITDFRNQIARENKNIKLEFISGATFSFSLPTSSSKQLSSKLVSETYKTVTH